MSTLIIASLPAFSAEQEEPGLHACNHVIDRTNHDKIVKGLTDQWKANNCDLHEPPATPGGPRPGQKDPAKCTDLHQADVYRASWENTELRNPRTSPLLTGRVHKGDMQKNCGGAGNNRGDRPFLANNVRQIQNQDGKLPGGAELQCVCRKAVDPKSVDKNGKPREPLTLDAVAPPPKPPAAPPAPGRNPQAGIIASTGEYVPPPARPPLVGTDWVWNVDEEKWVMFNPYQNRVLYRNPVILE